MSQKTDIPSTPTKSDPNHGASQGFPAAEPASHDGQGSLPVQGVPMQPTNGDTLVVHNQNWSTGLCDCMNDSANCCDTTLCHPCVLSMQFNRANNEGTGINYPMCLTQFLCDAFLTKGLILLGEAVYVRTTLRNRYNISLQEMGAGSSFVGFVKDYCSVLWCTPCATCQNHRELTLHGEWPGRVCFGQSPEEAAAAAAAAAAPTTSAMV